MTPTQTLHPGWTVQLAIHRAVRRDARRLSAALAADVGQASAKAIRDYWNETAAQLHDHHVLEDRVVWPLMAQRLGHRVDALLSRNAHEHQEMAAAMNSFDIDLAAEIADTTAARASLQQLVAAIETHLGHEESDVLPLIPEAFTLEDIAFFSDESAKTNPPNKFLPWLLDDATDTDAAFFTERLPAVVRIELETHWAPQRRITVDAIRLYRAAAAT